MYRYILILTFIGLFSSLKSQIGYGGQPSLKPIEKLNGSFKAIREMERLPASVNKKLNEDIAKKGDALRFAHPFFVNLTPNNSGEWNIDENGNRIWRLAIRSKGAYSLNLIFDRFNLAQGASVYIFDPLQRIVLGAFTNKNNQTSGNLATAPVPGDEIIVELHLPPGTEKQSDLMIGAINHDYLNIFPYFDLKGGGFGDSGSCNQNFTCNFDGMVRDLGRSVCKIIVDGTELCSGTLINNARRNGVPYFLTAAHCLKQANSASTVIFYFNYQVPKCESAIEGFPNQTLSGSFLRAYAEALDVALLEMSSIPPATYRPYWAGWSRTTTPAAPVKSIHHPEGDVKKIANSNGAPTATSFSASSPGGVPFISNSHWLVGTWQIGTTEPGSSGGGLFDNNGFLIGSLSGGAATCSNPVNDYFARLNKSWNHFSETNKQLAFWLDPDGQLPLSVTGFDYYDGSVERITNFVKEDVAVRSYIKPGKGVWAGHNSLSTKSFAERYPWVNSATIHGIYLVTANSVSSSSKSINLRIWNGSVEPEFLVASKNGIQLSQLKVNRDNLVLLNEPVQVTGPFWVEVELDYVAPVDSFAVYQSAPLASRIKNTAWLKSSLNQWNEFEDWQIGNYPASFWIDILASDVRKEETSVNEIDENSLFLYPNPFCNMINLRINGNGTGILEFFNIAGQRVYLTQITVEQGECTVNLPALNHGLYIVKININGRVYNQKVIVDNCFN